jgi:hypothetical protein
VKVPQKRLVDVDATAAVDDYGTSIITQNFYLFFPENALKADTPSSHYFVIPKKRENLFCRLLHKYNSKISRQLKVKKSHDLRVGFKYFGDLFCLHHQGQ